jgi:hypothetical protein
VDRRFFPTGDRDRAEQRMLAWNQAVAQCTYQSMV